MDMNKALEMQQALCEAGKKMYHSGLVAGTWGNLSVRIDDEYCVVTPSGMNYDTLCADDMVIMRMRDNHTQSKRRPTIEYAMHTGLLLSHPEVNAVVHTHSTYALAVATAGRELPPICDDQVQILGGSVRVTPKVMPGSVEMANAVVEAMKDRAGALVLNHGGVTIGRTLDEALTASIVLEKSCQVWILTMSIGGPKLLGQEEIDAMHDYFLNKYGQR